MKIQSKLPDTGTTIFSVMSALATKHNAVNLGQGFPDYTMSEELIALVNTAMRNGYNQYPSMQGYVPLREAIAAKIFNLYKNPVDPDKEIVITPGGTYAIFSALTTILNPGDEVIVMQPNYDSYVPNILINNAVPVIVDLELPDYSINWEKIRSVITNRTKAIILNSPHNPTGSILKEHDIVELKKTVEGTNIFIISDEVYEHIVFDGASHHSMLRYPELYQRSFVCFSFGKLYHCTGWKIGYCVAPPELTKELIKVHQFNAFSTNAPMQIALAQYLKKKETYDNLHTFFQQKRDYFIEAMRQTKFSLLNAEGSYFICATYKNISEEPANDFAIRLTKEAGVTTIPVSAFYQSAKDDQTIRFCFGKSETTLEKAIERLILFAK